MRIGFIAHAPGSVNVMGPLVDPLRELGHDVRVYPFSEYAVMKMGGIELGIDKYLPIFTEEYLDIVIYGTGSMHELEKDVSVLARHFGIYSISLLDALEPGREDLRYLNKPDKVICFNEDLQQHIVEVSEMNVEDVLPLGNPYIDQYEQYAGAEVKEVSVENATVVYASEPNGPKSMNDTSNRSKGVMLELIGLVNDRTIRELVIGLHPRESSKWISQQIEFNPRVRVSQRSTMEEAADADIVVNLGSTVHFECLLRGIKSIRYNGKEHLVNDIKNYAGVTLSVNYGATKRVTEYINQLQGNLPRKR